MKALRNPSSILSAVLIHAWSFDYFKSLPNCASRFTPDRAAPAPKIQTDVGTEKLESFELLNSVHFNRKKFFRI